MSFTVINSNTGDTYKVKEPYEGLEDVGKYLLMRAMRDDESGKYNINQVDSIRSFVNVRINHYNELDENVVMSMQDAIHVIVEEITTSYEVKHSAGFKIMNKELVFVKSCMLDLLSKSIFFQ